MSLALKSNWQPSASLENLRLRAQILGKIRQFFSERAVLEVETPVLGQYTITDQHITSLSVPTPQGRTYYLQTSPEYAMKRLLAAGAGSIYQIGKAFRAEENGHRHNSEFTLLEWYRVGFDHHQLMDEVDAMVQIILQTPSAERISYAQLFQQYFDLDIHSSTTEELRLRIKKAGWMQDNLDKLNYDDCLQLLLSHGIEAQLGHTAPLFIYDFPITQAALAKIRPDTPPVAERFELYIQGIEIANGFHELSDPHEQQQRFEADQQRRQQQNEMIPTIDPRLIAALAHGLPACAGVALGIDRLLMIAAKTNRINDVISFSWELS